MSSLPSTPNTRTKVIVPMISSVRVGTSGSCDAASARKCMVASLPAMLLILEDERGYEADERERLGQREPDPHVQRDAPGGLGLAGHRLDRVAEHEPDTDARADSREAVTDRADVDLEHRGRGRAGGENGGKRHVFSPYSSGRRASPTGSLGRIAVSALAPGSRRCTWRSRW